MLAGPVPKDTSWRVEQNDREITYTGAHGKVKIIKQPWHIEIYDQRGRLLTRTQNISDPATYPAARFPLCVAERSLASHGRNFRTTTRREDIRLWRIVHALQQARAARSGLHARRHGDAERIHVQTHSVLSEQQGYGMFVPHQRAVDVRLRQIYDAHNVIYSGDENLDIFLFLGEPKDILSSTPR